ncbi:hypothetical protein JCM10213_000790 [Rhodosporidiobolus nylandii]
MPKTILVTGVTGYIGAAVARAFHGAGWTVYGLIRRPSDAAALSAAGITPLVGSLSSLDWLAELKDVKLDAISSNTEDPSDMEGHYRAVRRMLDALAASGCKDYGRTPLADDPALAPHTEDSPLNPPAVLRPRTDFMRSILAAAAAGETEFDVIVLRPTNVYGGSSSYWGELFFRASRAAEKGEELVVPGNPRTVLHGCHVDDAAAAYVALASHSPRAEVVNRAFNISNSRYSTLGAAVDALAMDYGVEARCEPQKIKEDLPELAFSQWVGSDELRRATGWKETRPDIFEAIGQYRREYERALEEGDVWLKKMVASEFGAK